ncbi:AcvB/VirJ family lysyl-phosphatidylglycerol hydrolase [Shewanella polaris]|uniref:Virulence factor family protein n=1 Tax=Shewanella polaris TaxID=2588449 RepID=A0A4Y5YJ03_9GAMM|nr:AcvB/VirJ family lysyl-phosphatidylglycerol hydrolase [Shewanella polaris]QDE32782.1 virulence factor family protein [Shewanella polaris]
MSKLIFILILIISSAVQAEQQEIVNYGGFGDIHIYNHNQKPTQLVLFVSGDGGWDIGFIDMVKQLATTGAMVAAIDITHYLKVIGNEKGKCSYPAADFESLSQYLQQKYQFRQYSLPVLVGYSSGATLVYTVLAQSPPNTFQGGISLGFCPDLLLDKPLCQGNGSLSWRKDPKLKNNYLFDINKQLPSAWFALQGENDQVCNAQITKDYVEKVGNGNIVMLPKVGHGFAVTENWFSQFQQAFNQLAAKELKTDATIKPDSLNDLPLIELPTTSNKNQPLAIILTGDGGWAGIDKSIGESLNKQGIPVVGFNSLQYFWNRKSPEQAALDLGNVIKYYTNLWSRKQVILIGYSRGADVLPFMRNGLTISEKNLVKEMVVLGQSKTVDFQFHVSDWLMANNHDSELAVIPEMQKLTDQNILCVYGIDEKPLTTCSQLNPENFHIVEMSGGHHFSGDYEKLVHIILEHIQ